MVRQVLGIRTSARGRCACAWESISGSSGKTIGVFLVIDRSGWVPLPPRKRRGGVRGGGPLWLSPPPGSSLREKPPSPPLVQVGCFRLGPIMKLPNPGTPGFGGGRVGEWGSSSVDDDAQRGPR